MDERFYWLGFSAFSGVGPVKFKNLLNNFGSAENAWNAKTSDLQIIFGEKLTEKFEDFKSRFLIENYIKVLQRKGVTFTCWEDPQYPSLLKQIKNPPFVLYSLGNLSNLGDSSRLIAVVGTRKVTQYGREVTQLLTQELVNAGFAVVSGLAFGVDTIAHQTAIETGGKTIAVLGSGVDLCYPSANKHLYDLIINGNGAVVSEFPLGETPSKGSFPSRNRIIAGLSMGVLVTEGAEDSGSLITADYALRFGRRVFAVPGPITSSLSKGPYRLIEKGAKLVTSVENILNELKFQITNSKSQINSKNQNSKKKTENKDEQLILEILEKESLTFDQIAKITKLDSANLGSILSIMEIKGFIKSSEGGIYSL